MNQFNFIDLGFDTFGENKVQEILKKYEYVDGKVKFHRIGHLQTKKVKSIIDKVELIHSLDRISLLDKLELEAKNKGITGNVPSNSVMAGYPMRPHKEWLKFGLSPGACV